MQKRQAETATNTANDAQTATNNAQQTATDAQTTANEVKNIVANKADANRAYAFNIENSVGEQNNKTGQAEGWDLSNDGEITFGATSDLEVSTDGTGKIVYGLSTVAKTAISAVADACKNCYR
ncbi:hypothetical protein [Actinobacillus arthritidis]|uniref:hypothetical protein n=1 Tax=Actinobacillus arthritidis TaxID=157339 RepID=UPI002441212A|nr:hypothetical protein [Actinobacillus arthritidis]WGE88994.1 hypothetical protein NYR89_08005 [Actinobacillus arthritidis]